MMIGVLCFELMPGQMLHVFSHDAEVIRIGKVAFRIIAVSFIPLVTSLTFPVTDIITSIAGFLLYRRFLRFTKSS